MQVWEVLGGERGLFGLGLDGFGWRLGSSWL